MKSKWGALAAVIAAGVLAAGCGSGDGDEKGGLPKADKLAADNGARYKKLNVPALDGLTCDKGDGGFRFGSDRDMGVYGDDDLKEIEISDEDKVACFGASRITLTKGSRQATVPHFTTRTTLYEKVADPAASLDKVFEHTMHLEKGYGRTPVGEPKSFTTKDLVLKCRQNVSDTFPMTTCFWANYGAIGVVDFFPPDGKHVPVDEAAARTHKFALGILSTGTP
ncbi:hypothetical protein [Streptomyces griseocarneus]|uniref:hypothetical protein n=1 Tax=Streptomyces griseocarneus TaxID=51201 RepID=UPI00167D9332|nr:hypothetical protein [Streptomyces griseocarneus]MBZ6476407.1 hypothetical protein [Streptomyces griseocarneus]GHG79113.1 hypothetical protein GCM10018779_59720 [Streptomyces griseocarneus]